MLSKHNYSSRSITTGSTLAARHAGNAVAPMAASSNVTIREFGRDEKDPAGPYLGDSLAMGRAFLTLYGATGDRNWLAPAQSTATYIHRNFKHPQAGYITAKASKQQRDENMGMARYANLLFRFSANEEYKQMASHAMRYLAEPYIARLPLTAGVLIADAELSSEPVHITVVGHKDDPTAQGMFQAAARYPSGYKRVEWWDMREGRLPNPYVMYPQLKTAAAFVCTSNTRSAPIFKADTIRAKVDKLTGTQGA